MNLAGIWFFLLGVLLAGYAILDGFDLGVGILHPFVGRRERHRRQLVQAIGPLWDGNEVWLVAFGGALLAAFPEAYATLLSAFYELFMLLLFALIFRAVSLEFRNKIAASGWRRAWDGAFFLSSLTVAAASGLVLGNVLRGIPLDARGVFTGRFTDLLGPYPVLVALLTVATLALHGAIYLQLKTTGSLQRRLGPWIWRCWGVFLALYLLTTIWTLNEVPRASLPLAQQPWSVVLIGLSVLAVANVPRSVYRRRFLQAFISSALTIGLLVALCGAALYPELVPASNDPALGLTIERAASSRETLGIMLLVAAIGMPFVIAYTAIVYWTFRGPVGGGGPGYGE